MLLPTLVFVGLATFDRVLQSGVEDLGYARRIARLRAFYFDNAPELGPYLLSVPPAERLHVQGLRGRFVQGFLSVAGMVGVITAVLAGSEVGLALVAAFAALADPRRRAMLRLVRNEPRSVNEIATHFDITQQAVSQHLQMLKQAGLVAMHPDGQRRLYLIRPEGLEALSAFLADLWPSGLQRLKRVVERNRAR